MGRTAETELDSIRRIDKISGMRLRLLFVVLMGLEIVYPAYGQDAQFQQDPVEHLTANILTILIVLGISLILYSLIRYRGRLTTPASWGILIVGLGVFPVMTGMVGTVLVFERADH